MKSIGIAVVLSIIAAITSASFPDTYFTGFVFGCLFMGLCEIIEKVWP